MKYGFSFKGTHTGSIPGLTVRTASRPIKPETRDTKFIVPFADGAISTAADNPYRREFYEPRIFTMTMMLTAGNMMILNKRLEKVSSWLTGTGKLIFDDTPLIEWDAAAYGSVDYAPERSGTKAVISVSFEAAPFGRLAWNVLDGPKIGQRGIYLRDELPLGPGKYVITMREDETDSVLFPINNCGDRHIRPIIRMRATGTDSSARTGIVKIDVDSSEMVVSGGEIVKTAIVDCDKHTVTDAHGSNILGRLYTDQVWITGEFTELQPGRNSLSVKRIVHEGDGGIEIEFDFVPEFIWDADIERIGRRW